MLFLYAKNSTDFSLSSKLKEVKIKIRTKPQLSPAKDYVFAVGYCVEYYDDPQKYPNGTADENYYCEIWIPVKIPIFGVFTKRQRRVAVYSVSII